MTSDETRANYRYLVGTVLIIKQCSWGGGGGGGVRVGEGGI